MNADEAVERFRELGKQSSIAKRMVGYAYLVQRDGWEGLGRYAAQGTEPLREGFAEARVDPLTVEFVNGARPYLEELVRSSAHPGAVERARELLTADERGGQ